MTEDQIQAEVVKLRQMAIDKYEEDGGTMYECFSQQDYVNEVVEHGSADAAWAWNIRIVEASREAGGYYEKF
jgi:hypothetical protein